MNRDEKPHPLNAPDGFYVLNDCCTACNVPHDTAPEIFAYDEEFHCYVKRQPKNKDELNRAILVTMFAELECVRYNGSDSETIRRIAEMGNSHLCDSPTAKSIKPIFRNHVTFQCLTENSLSPKELAIEFKNWLIDDAHEHLNYKFKRTFIQLFSQLLNVSETNPASLTFSWYEDNFHTVNFSATENNSTWHVFQSANEDVGSRAVSRMIHEWITQDSRFSNSRWYSEYNWLKLDKWQETPF